MEQKGNPREVVVTVDGVPRPAVVMDVDGERSRVRYRDAGGFTLTWVPTQELLEVEPGKDRPPILKLLALALVAIAGLFLLLHPGGSDTRLADLVPTPTPTTSASSAAPAPSPSLTAAVPGPVKAVIFGDSFTSGKGNAAGTRTALQIAARQLRWQADIRAANGTGFTTGGSGGQPFGERVQQEVRTAPDVLVLQGGSSDTPATAAQLTAAANAVIDQVQRRFPSTRVVLVGPVAMEQPADGQLVRVSRVLAAVAKAQGVPFVDPIASGWITADNAPGYTAPTGYYPNTAGHAYLAGRLAAVLPGLIS